MSEAQLGAALTQPVLASRRMGRRLLSGAGCASLTPYRANGAGAGSLLVVHALDTEGRIIVAAIPPAGHALADAVASDPLDVRLDVTLESADPQVRVTTASAHLLGVVTWLDEVETAFVLAGQAAGCHCPITGENPLATLAEFAAAPGGRLGVVDAARVVVHDAQGVSSHRIADLLHLEEQGRPVGLWSAMDEVFAQGDVAALGEASLDALCSGVLADDLPGMLCSLRPASPQCGPLRGRVLCVDVAPGAVTLMRFSKQGVETIQVWLPSHVVRASQVVPVLRDMVAEAVAASLTMELLG